MTPGTYWIDGRLVTDTEGAASLSAHGLHYGYGVFEGIRGYAVGGDVALFRLDDHLRRFERSAQILGIPLGHSGAEITRAVVSLTERAGFGDCYIRPMAFYGGGPLGMGTAGRTAHVAVLVDEWEQERFDSEPEGIRVAVSTWRRPGPDTLPYQAKSTGMYLNSVLGKREAQASGADDALFLTQDGLVGDASGANVFTVSDGVLRTPPRSTGLLCGITRDTVMELAVGRGLRVVEEPVTLADLSTADEVFLTGTGLEIRPVEAVGDRVYGCGPTTRLLAHDYQKAVRGDIDGFRHRVTWLRRDTQ
ncbi:branched-chain-amino-acid transaminase [Streptomyces sp. NPDC049627]|uniref:branched-chain-amino-acid transaminase n=1 Tax=Streptomyces sp. NPDC049627 TaxID=3365595 RepID=UPI003787A706